MENEIFFNRDYESPIHKCQLVATSPGLEGTIQNNRGLKGGGRAKAAGEEGKPP